MRYFVHVLEDRLGKGLFLLFLVLSYFVIPASALGGLDLVLAAVFMLTTALSLTCIAKSIGAEIELVRHGTSAITIIATIIGVSAFHVCAVGAAACGAALGSGILAVFASASLLGFLEDYSTAVIVAVLVVQMASLYFMGCFKKC